MRRVPDTPTCQAWSNDKRDVSKTSVAQAIANGRVVFDSNNALACLGAYSNLSCDETIAGQGPSECDELLEGTVDSAGTCEISQECISQFCDIPTCDGACCQGTCVGGTAPSRQATGMSCGDKIDGCVTGDYCDLGLGICKQLVAVGSACDDVSACKPGYACVNDVCKTLPRTGEPCPDGACTNIGDHCGSAGFCVNLGMPGDSCASSSDCAPFFTCDLETLKCTTGPTLGEPCTHACFGASIYCSVEVGSAMPVCTASGSDDAACSATDQCISGDCDNGVCATPMPCY